MARGREREDDTERQRGCLIEKNSLTRVEDVKMGEDEKETYLERVRDKRLDVGGEKGLNEGYAVAGRGRKEIAKGRDDERIEMVVNNEKKKRERRGEKKEYYLERVRDKQLDV